MKKLLVIIFIISSCYCQNKKEFPIVFERGFVLDTLVSCKVNNQEFARNVVLESDDFSDLAKIIDVYTSETISKIDLKFKLRNDQKERELSFDIDVREIKWIQIYIQTHNYSEDNSRNIIYRLNDTIELKDIKYE